ncbi:MAG: hypothetical protein WAL45_17495 [Terracidiphilus sp.]
MTPRERGNQSECPPEKYEDSYAACYLFAHRPAEKMPEGGEHKVEKDVVPSRGEPETWSLSGLNESCQPRVVNVGGKIAGFKMTVPEAWDQERRGNQ